MAEAKKLVDAKIAGKRVVIISKSYCPYCKMAKDVFKAHYLGKDLSADEYEVWEIENRDDCEAIQNYLNTLTGGRTVPRVFIKGKCIGGGTETKNAHSSGELKRLLAA